MQKARPSLDGLFALCGQDPDLTAHGLVVVTRLASSLSISTSGVLPSSSGSEAFLVIQYWVCRSLLQNSPEFWGNEG
ncbi:MAG: hypothetical protein LH609_08225 [Rudanella sp.]|nr:hypothetical protein [Rudanella sp.]